MEQHGAAGKCGKAGVPRNLYGQCLRVLEEHGAEGQGGQKGPMKESEH